MAPEVDLRSPAGGGNRVLVGGSAAPVVVVDHPPIVVTTPQRSWRPALGAAVFTLLNVALAIAAILAPLQRMVAANEAEVNPWWGYTAAEWLLNYGGGPVRRGLAGEVLRHLPFESDRVATSVVVVGLMVTVPLLFAVLVQLAGRATRAGWPLLLWGLPGGLLLGTWQAEWLPLSDSQILFATRKEYAFFAALLLLAIGLGLSHHIRLMAIAFSAAMVAGALTHEALTIPFTVAGVALVYFAGQRTSQQRTNLAIIGVPATLAVGVAAALPTSTDARIAEQWGTLDSATRQWLGGDLPWPFRWLGFTLHDAVESTIVYMLRPEMLPVWLMLGVVVAGWTVAALALVDRSGAAFRSTLAVAGVMTVAVLPLAAVGIDWGRFIMIAANCTAIVMLGRQLHRPRLARPARLSVVTVAVAATLIATLAFVGVPEAGPPLGELRGVTDPTATP